jgi:hypothetical protein
MPRPSHSSLFYHPHSSGEQYRSWSFSLCSFLHTPFTSSLLGPSILLHNAPLTAISNYRVTQWLQKRCTRQLF